MRGAGGIGVRFRPGVFRSLNRIVAPIGDMVRALPGRVRHAGRKRQRGGMATSGQSEFGASWYAAVTPLPAPRPPLSFDLDVDVCIVGGGLAGLAVARETARRGFTVALVEARRLAWNASGRNSGFVVPGFAERPEKLVERVGLPAARTLWALSEQGVRHVRSTTAELGVPEDGRGFLELAKTNDPEGARARLELLGRDLGADVEAWPLERVRDTLQTNHYFSAIHFPGAFHINPLAYALRLAAAAERAGAHIFEHSPAVEIDPAGVRKRVVTPNGRLRAAHIVLAGNIHIGSVAQRLAETLFPIRAYTGVTKPLGEKVRNAIGFAGAISDSQNANWHYRIVGDDRLMWTGAAAVDPFGGPAMKRRLQRGMWATYPQLGRIEFETCWPSDMGFALHRMPQVGEVQPGVWLASAFGSHGLNTSAIVGVLIARAIVEGDDGWRVFLPYELVWAGGRAGRVLVQGMLAWSSVTEAAAALLARRRETLRRRRLHQRLGVPIVPPRPAYRSVDPSTRPTAAPPVPNHDAHLPKTIAVQPPRPEPTTMQASQ
jgi:gamma-glutamylputrescine oxidase